MQNSKQAKQYDYPVIDKLVSFLEYAIVVILFTGLGYAFAVNLAGR